MTIKPRVAGFTIVETLVVLAVTAALLLSASFLIAGRSRTTEFSQGIHSLQLQLHQTISDVQNGYYDNNGSIHCVGTLGGPKITSSSTDQGTNQGCIFFGKVLQFGIGSNPEQYNVYTMVALDGTEDSAGPPLGNLKPIVIAKSSFYWGKTHNIPDVYNTVDMPYGLTVKKMYYGSDPSDNSKKIGSVGIATTVGNFGTGGSQAVNILAIKGTHLARTKDQGVKEIDVHLYSSSFVGGDAVVNPDGGVNICVVSNGSNQSGLLTLGANGDPTSVQLAIKYNGNCS